MSARHAGPFIRDVFTRFRRDLIDARQAAGELELSRSRFYVLYSAYLRACAERRQPRWVPGRSGGDHRQAWPAIVIALLRKLLGVRPPVSYSFAASEILRRHDLRLDRASIRRFALRENLAPDTRYKTRPNPVRHWQVAQIGQLWQYDASPHRWFADQDRQPVLLELIDDHSRLIPAAQLYPRETLLAHFDLLSGAFRRFSLPLALYVDYHSFFFTHTAEAFTQLGAALHFYEVSLRFAPHTPSQGQNRARP